MESKETLIEQSLGYLLEEALIKDIIQSSQLKSYDGDHTIIHIGDEMRFMPIVLSGSIKVLRENAEGDDLLLYYIEGGDTCAMTLQCCVNASWRAYILQSYHVRLTELMETVDAIAFMKLDERLLKYLTDQAKLLGSLEIHHTHQQIAEDLNSSRVVISRLLKQLETKGLITLQRNKIVLGSI
jgi:CRP/FNR family transcriptional regulator